MRRLTCATALGVRTASVVESLVPGIWNYKPVARLAVDVEHKRETSALPEELGNAIILKTEGVQSIVALAEAVKAFRQMTQFLGSVQVARHCRTLCDNSWRRPEPNLTIVIHCSSGSLWPQPMI